MDVTLANMFGNVSKADLPITSLTC